MRRKPSHQNGGFNNNNQQRKPRFPQGGSNGGGHPHNHNRPRKNYAAAREKYLAQARDALASGDRVLAENYYQHAEHCYRMMVEEGYQIRNSYTPPAQGEEQGQPAAVAQDEQVPAGNSQLPAFITENYEQPEAKPAEQIPVVQNWEERDA